MYAGADPNSYFHPKPWWTIKLFTEKSGMDNSPLKKIVSDILDNRFFQRKLCFMSIDVETGEVIIFDESIDELSHEERINALISSTSIPGAFAPERIDGRSLADGSLHTTVAIGEPINRCRDEGYKDEDIIIDILMCYTGVYDVESWDLEGTRWYNALDFYRRRKSITHYYFYKEDMLRMFRGYKDIDFRLTIMPRTPLTAGAIPLSATADDVAREYVQGYEDGLAATDEYLARTNSTTTTN